LYFRTSGPIPLPLAIQDPDHSIIISLKNTEGHTHLPSAQDHDLIPLIYKRAQGHDLIPFIYKRAQDHDLIPFIYKRAQDHDLIPLVYKRAQDHDLIPLVYSRARPLNYLGFG
jgi:hypothetical protein